MLRKYDTNSETVEKILSDYLGMLSGKELLTDDKGELIKVVSMPENVSLC